MNTDDLNNEIFEGLSSDELFKRAKECVNYFSKLEKNNLMLTTQAELLNKKVFELNLRFNSEIKCVNCGSVYLPGDNNSEACNYHSGSLRYFSCRGCGADDYYQCCSKCIRCSKGCKVSRHTS